MSMSSVDETIIPSIPSIPSVPVPDTDFQDKDLLMAELLGDIVEGNYCMNCGAELEKKPKGSPGRPRRFCSEKCSREYWKDNPRPDRWKSYERVRCGFCGKWFYARKDAERKYCSISCSNKARGIRRILSDSNP